MDNCNELIILTVESDARTLETTQTVVAKRSDEQARKQMAER